MSPVLYALLPGAGGVAAYWDRLADELRHRGQHVVAIDLPGDDPSAGLAEYADIAVDAIGDRAPVVLVAQSLGGFTAPLVCERVPVRLLVLLNPMIPVPGETAGDWWAHTGSSQARRDNDIRAGRDPDAEFDLTSYFFHDIPADQVQELRAGGRDEAERVFADSIERWPPVPTKVLTGVDDRFFPADFQRRVAEERLGIVPDLMPGGHLVALSHPVELADRLEAYRIEAGLG